MRNQIKPSTGSTPVFVKATLLATNCPSLSHYNVEEPSRLLRLAELVGFLSGRFNCNPHELKAKHGLLALHDHKGELTSVWDTEKNFVHGIKQVVTAWSVACEHAHTAVVYRGEDYQLIEVSA